jgi:pyrophosphatase PpaX
VLFDLDGTLADTVELIVRCYRHTMTVHLGEAPPDERWLAGIGMPLRDQLKGFARDPDEVGRMAETYAAFQRTIHDGMVAPYPGAVEVVGALRGQGVPVGIVTSKRHGMAERTLERCGFGGMYDVLVGADDVARGKPDPEPVLLALHRLDLVDAAARVLFVGDSPYDMRAGRAAGSRTAGVLWGPFRRDVLQAEQPDYLVSAPGDLLALG